MEVGKRWRCYDSFSQSLDSYGVILVVMFFLTALCADAKTDCRDLHDPRRPGLKECVASVELEGIAARPPTPKQMSLWCWAASLSMIYTLQGHPITQDSIVLQNFGALTNGPSGDFLAFFLQLNRSYKDNGGDIFRSSAKPMKMPEQIAEAFDNDIGLLYVTLSHATVQTALKYQQRHGGRMVVKGGRIWDPATGEFRNLSASDVAPYKAVWAIETQ